MNILIIGNGFDLAHKLPTRYADFLNWIKAVKYKMEEDYDMKSFVWKEDNSKIKSFINNEEDAFYLSVWKEMIKKNRWVEYFLSSDEYQEKGWIDFETEMSTMIQVVEMVEEKFDKGESFEDLQKKQKNILYRLFGRPVNIREKLSCSLKPISEKYHIDNLDKMLEILEMFGAFKGNLRIKELEIEKLWSNFVEEISNWEKDLNRLILLLEKYLCHYILNQEVAIFSPDIKAISVDKVLSFNYTDTYERIYVNDYLNKPTIKYDYVHGKAKTDSMGNNMVLGIDEYLSNDKKDKNVKYIAYKKYYQRILKGVGNEYKVWIQKIKEDRDRVVLGYREDREGVFIQVPINKFPNDAKHNIYFFGHSLDITDRDIIRDLILNDNVYTTVFYFNKDDLGKKISNLVKVIGQDELIRRTGGSTKTIEFKQQQDMISIKNNK